MLKIFLVIIFNYMYRGKEGKSMDGACRGDVLREHTNDRAYIYI